MTRLGRLPGAVRRGAGRGVRAGLRRSTHARDAATWVRRRQQLEVVRGSGLFDGDWYAAQLTAPPAAATGGGPAGRAALVEHYVRTGSAADLSPTPWFDPSWYRATYPESARGGREPFAHFLSVGARRSHSPHPFFDGGWYLEQHPEAAGHARGAFGHYLEVGAPAGHAFHPDIDVARVRPGEASGGDAFTDLVQQAGRVLRETRGRRDVPRQVPTFDHAAAAAFKRDVLGRHADAGGDQPLVTVVIPTKDRARDVVEAVRSVVHQTYRNLQLVVVDDGGTDDTHELLRPYLEDPRVELVVRERPGGVSAARNAGARRARGEYLAWLDSDNTWHPDFLEVMVAFVRTRGIRAGYAVSELEGSGNLAYRATPFDGEALRERNFIDCIVLLHERSLFEEAGGFDESLRRMVDWDLMIRMARISPFELAPFVGTTYDLWEERSDRITNREPWGFRYVIRAKHRLDWDGVAGALPDRDPSLTSVVVVARGPVAQVEKCVQRVAERTAAGTVEVVLADAGTPPDRYLRLELLRHRFPAAGVRVVRVPEELSLEVATGVGIGASRGGHVVLLSSDLLVERGWLEPLLEPLREQRAAATAPLVLAADGTVLSAGMCFPARGLPHHLLRGVPWDSAEVARAADRSAVSSMCLAARAEDLVAVRGLDPFRVNAVDDADLSLRLTEHRGLPARVEPASAAVRLAPRASDKPLAPTDVDNRRHFEQRWAGRVPHDDVEAWGAAGHRVLGYRMHRDAGMAQGLTLSTPVVVRERPAAPLRWAIKIAVPDVVDRDGWGDYYFAAALRDALHRAGHEAVVDVQSAWYRPTTHDEDVVLALRGKTPYVPNIGHTNLLWLISHPETVTAWEVARSDAVLVASTAHAARMTAEHGRLVEPLLQCTDQNRFAPGPDGDTHGSDVVFVGNSRGVRRQVVQDALSAGLDLAVYGNGWKGLIPPSALRARYVPNAELARLYRTSGVVLNDHWEDMRSRGFLSNRLFDLAACGARVVSDDVAGLHEVFGDVVATYEGADGLQAAVARQLRDEPDRVRARVALAERVRREHTFDARAARLVEIAEKLRASQAAPAVSG